MKLSQTGIRLLVKDFQKCFDFYTEKLGVRNIKIGRKALAVNTDITCMNRLITCLKEPLIILEEFDILVINAGANYDWETVENSNLENWKRTLDVNLFGAYYCAHSSIPFLRRGVPAR